MARTEPTPVRQRVLLDSTGVRLALGRRIAELRRERGWNQTVLGEKMGWSLQYVSRVESGAENFRLTRLVDIANVLEVDLLALLKPPKSLVVRRGRPPKTSPKTSPKMMTPAVRAAPKRSADKRR